MKYINLTKVMLGEKNIKYYQNLSAAAFDLQGKSIENYKLENCPALMDENSQSAIVLEPVTDHIFDGVYKLPKNIIHEIFVQVDEHDYGPDSYYLSVNSNGNKHKKENIYLTKEKVYWVRENNKVELEPERKEFAAMQTTLQESLNRYKTRLDNKFSETFNLFNQKQAEYEKIKKKLEAVQTEMNILDRHLSSIRN